MDNGWKERFYDSSDVKGLLSDILKDVGSGSMAPAAGADKLLSVFHGSREKRHYAPTVT